MHPYQIDEDIKKRVFIVCAILATAAARALTVIIQEIPFEIPWWIEIPSVLGFFGLFIWLFDDFLWKTKLVRRIPWLYIPNLKGTWDTQIRSSHTEFHEPTHARTVIRQTASKISISMETNLSISNSIHAGLLKTDKLNEFELTYNYTNKPKADASPTMHMHQGAVWLQVAQNEQLLEGEYYSGRGRQNFGTLELRQTRE